MKIIRVAIADDHSMVRSALAAFLSKQENIEVVAELTDIANLSETIAECQPDVLLLDAYMPGRNVIKTAQQLCEAQPATNILVLSAYDQYDYVVNMLRAGVSGYMLKSDSLDLLLRAISCVAEGEKWLSSQVIDLLVSSALPKPGRGPTKLTKRENEVLQLMASGCNNGQIADSLFITTQTVKNHIRNIFNKLGVESRVEAVLFAVNNGMAQPEMEAEAVVDA